MFCDKSDYPSLKQLYYIIFCEQHTLITVHSSDAAFVCRRLQGGATAAALFLGVTMEATLEAANCCPNLTREDGSNSSSWLLWSHPTLPALVRCGNSARQPLRLQHLRCH